MKFLRMILILSWGFSFLSIGALLPLEDLSFWEYVLMFILTLFVILLPISGIFTKQDIQKIEDLEDLKDGTLIDFNVTKNEKLYVARIKNAQSDISSGSWKYVVLRKINPSIAEKVYKIKKLCGGMVLEPYSL